MSGRGGEEEKVIYVLQMAQDYLTIADVGKLMHVKVTTVRELALRDVDPIPFRIFEDQRRNPLVHADEFKLWWDRNTVLNDKLRTPPNVTLINLPPRTAA